MRATTILSVILAIGWVGGPVRAGETIIRVGDTIAISAFGLPELDKKALVDKSGEISYPAFGSIKAAGMTTNDLRRKIIEGLVRSGMPKDPRIGVEIASREPFYVTGDVASPGVQPYSVNVTVRSAVAFAGGIEQGGMRESRATGNSAELQGQYEALALELVKQRAHVRKLEAGLADKKIVSFDDFSDLPVTKDVVKKLNELESAELRMRDEETDAEKLYLQKVIADTQTQIVALAGLRKSEEDSARQQTEQVSKVKSFTDRGMVVQGRLLDEQRTLLASQAKLFETTATVASTSRLLEELQRKLQAVDETRRLTFVKELQDAYIAAAGAEARLSAVRQQLNIKVDQPRFVAGENQPHFVIFRENGDSRTRLVVDEDADVEPGDIIEVRTGGARAVAVE